MKMQSFQAIDTRFASLEAEVDRQLEKIKKDEERLAHLTRTQGDKFLQPMRKVLNHSEAIARNTSILKSLEVAKARLRSRSTFSPIEQVLEKSIHNYQKSLESSLGTAPTAAVKSSPAPSAGAK